MIRGRTRTLAVAWLLAGSVATASLSAQSLPPKEREALDGWYRHTVERTPGGLWGIALVSMDGRILWSASPELELVPASTAKLFTTGFPWSVVGGNSRITTRVVGDGALDRNSGRWVGAWALELGGDPTLERSGRNGPKLLELARRLRERGVRVLEGPLALTSRTGPAASSYPATCSTEFQGKLYAPPVGPVTLHENTVSLTFRPGRDVGSPPSLVSAYPAGVDRLIHIAATTVGGSGSRLWLVPAPDG